jgi:hypothetical protein
MVAEFRVSLLEGESRPPLVLRHDPGKATRTSLRQVDVDINERQNKRLTDQSDAASDGTRQEVRILYQKRNLTDHLWPFFSWTFDWSGLFKQAQSLPATRRDAHDPPIMAPATPPNPQQKLS